MRIDSNEIIIAGKLYKMARIKDEWYNDVKDPSSLIKELQGKADIFTFWQRLPETKPKYNYYMEWESIAAIPIISFDHWWRKQLDPKMRNKIRKAEKNGVIGKVIDFDDELVKGIKKIYDESPIRQGRPFWHYMKNLNIIKKEHATYLDRSDFIGAYYNDELIGFFKIVYEEKFACLMNAISKIEHRDKVPTNILVAKAVELCDKKKLPYLIYGVWSEGTLGSFKRHNGCIKVDLPRYYIPLTIKGKMALNLKLYRNVKGIIPEKFKYPLKNLRLKWYKYKYRDLMNV